MTIQALVNAIPPPTEPFDAFSGPWEPIESELGVVLPQDYKEFVRLYGSGYFMGFFGISVPQSVFPNIRLVPNVRDICDIFVHLDEEFQPYPFWPAPGGLLPFGTTDNADCLFWLPRGQPEDWGVVVWDRGLGNYEVFDCGLTEFLAGLVTGEILPTEFEDMLSHENLFVPHTTDLARRFHQE